MGPSLHLSRTSSRFLTTLALLGALSAVMALSPPGSSPLAPEQASAEAGRVCRGQHPPHGYVVTAHIIDTALCDFHDGTYYAYNANIFDLPADGQTTCNGQVDHGDPPAPYVITSIQTSTSCVSYTQSPNYDNAYQINVARPGMIVCDVQRAIPSGWVISDTTHSMDCLHTNYAPSLADNAYVINPA